MELTNADDFKSDSKWIGKRLGISEFEVQLVQRGVLQVGSSARSAGRPAHHTG